VPPPACSALASKSNKTAVEAVISLAVERRRSKPSISCWPSNAKCLCGRRYVVKIRDKEIRYALTSKSEQHHHPQGLLPIYTKTTARFWNG
jgi:methylmalonyl-CoA mutase